MAQSRLLFHLAVAAWALAWSSFRLMGAEPAAEDPSIVELKALDMDIARFEELFPRYDDPYYKPQVAASFEKLKARAEAVRKNFAQQQCDDLRFDLNQEIQRMWVSLQPAITPPPTKKQTVELSKLNPSAANPAEIKAALDALDLAIAREQGRLAKNAPDFEKIRKGRAELAKQFTTAQWVAVTSALEAPPRAEWLPRSTVNPYPTPVYP